MFINLTLPRDYTRENSERTVTLNTAHIVKIEWQRRGFVVRSLVSGAQNFGYTYDNLENIFKFVEGNIPEVEEYLERQKSEVEYEKYL